LVTGRKGFEKIAGPGFIIACRKHLSKAQMSEWDQKQKKSSLEKEPFENQSKITVRMNYLISPNMGFCYDVTLLKQG